MYTNLFDSHTHSENSPDGNHSVLYMCEQAIANGLTGIAITDHMEANDYVKDNYRTRIQQSIFDITKAQQLLGDRLMISCGVELGQALHNTEAALEVLNMHNFDFVLGSLHAPLGKPDYYYWNFNDPSIVVHDTLVEYYQQQIELAKWGNFDIMGHITYPIRYIWGRSRIPVDISRYSDLIDQLMRTLIENGRGLEVNTSGLRQELGTTLPDLPLLKRYHELGGELITIGSDAHYTEHVGAGVEYAMDMLRSIGFKYFCFYKNREPRMLQLA